MQPRELSTPPHVVNSETGCWESTAGRTRGYANGKPHRRSYEIHNGPIPEGWHIHHKCEVRHCVNPEHLEAIDPTEHWMQHRIGERGIGVDDITEIRRLGRERSSSAPEIAERYGLHEATIYRYWHWHSWAGVFDGPIELEPGTCPMCGGEVVGKRTKVYCSRDCVIKAKIIRQREKRRTTRAA